MGVGRVKDICRNGRLRPFVGQRRTNVCRRHTRVGDILCAGGALNVKYAKGHMSLRPWVGTQTRPKFFV